MTWLQHPEFRLHYQSRINGDEPIVFIHGNFGSWRYWQCFLQQLPEGFCGYAPDLRGCGDSEAPDSGYDINTLSKDILYFADQLDLGKFHLVGHSLGGAVAQELAGYHADRILSLTLVAPVPSEGLASLNQINTSNGLFSPESIFNFLGKVGFKKKLLTIIYKKAMPQLKNNTAFLNIALEDAMKMDVKALLGFLETLKVWTGTKLLKHFTFPVLIIHGSLDTIIPSQPLVNMQKSIGNSHFQAFNGVGHSPMLELPNAFNALLNTFLKQGNNTNFSLINTSASRKSSWTTGFRKTLKKITSKLN